MQFPSWVEPLARQMRAARLEVIDFARSAPTSLWQQPSPLEGWTCHDVLAHLAGGDDRMLQSVLQAVIAGEEVPSEVLHPGTDAENARGVAARRDWTVERLIEELERDGAETQALLAGLREEYRDVQPSGAPWTVGRLVQVVYEENHDLEHLSQLRLVARTTSTTEA
jgi:uncharacterized protein (TIGR03083 family)